MALVICTDYLSRTLTTNISAVLDAHANTINGSASALGATVCAVAGTAGLVPGLVCAAGLGLWDIDVGYVIDEFHTAATQNECVRIPLYLPWLDPIPDNGGECFN
ncbi:MAG: hypothetical protein ACLP8S_00200 [Solirubrobacteraceae bacterium]